MVSGDKNKFSDNKNVRHLSLKTIYQNANKSSEDKDEFSENEDVVSYGLWPWRDGKVDISKLVRGGFLF